MGMDLEGNNAKSSSTTFPIEVQVCIALLFTFAIRAAQTLALHCVELLVNLSRDERTWRRAALPLKATGEIPGTGGAQLRSSALKSAVSSWENAILFVMKALLHWLLGQCLQSTIIVYGEFWSWQFQMCYIRIFVYSIVAILLAIFSTYLALQKPKGPQPAAWGHLRTLANLADNWEME